MHNDTSHLAMESQLGNLMLLTTDSINEFDREGFLVIRDVVGKNDIMKLREAIDLELELRTGKKFSYQNEKDGAFHGSQEMWANYPALDKICRSSNLPRIASQLMRSKKVNLFFDHLFVKEPNSPFYTNWHNDLPYWPIMGSQIISFWIPVDTVTRESGALEFLPSSHKLYTDLQPDNFASKVNEIPFSKRDYPEENIKCTEVDVGDIVAFHALTIHRGLANNTSRRRRAYSIRYAGDDVVYSPRPGVHKMMLVKQLHAGGEIDCNRYPVVYNSSLETHL